MPKTDDANITGDSCGAQLGVDVVSVRSEWDKFYKSIGQSHVERCYITLSDRVR